MIFLNCTIFIFKLNYLKIKSIGYKYLSVDEVLLMFIFVPLLKYTNISTNVYTNGVNILLALIILVSIYNNVDFIVKIYNIINYKIFINIILLLILLFISYYILRKNNKYSLLTTLILFYIFTVYNIVTKI